MLVKALRKRWPKVEIVLRADSGFCRWRMLRWCEDNNVGYVVGVGKNNVLMESAAGLVAEAERQHGEKNRKRKRFDSFMYAAKPWDRERRVIVKAGHNSLGPNTRFVVTSLAQTDRHLYERVYCARGDMENRIKNQQLELRRKSAPFLSHFRVSFFLWSTPWQPVQKRGTCSPTAPRAAGSGRTSSDSCSRGWPTR